MEATPENILAAIAENEKRIDTVLGIAMIGESRLSLGMHVYRVSVYARAVDTHVNVLARNAIEASRASMRYFEDLDGRSDWVITSVTEITMSHVLADLLHSYITALGDDYCEPYEADA